MTSCQDDINLKFAVNYKYWKPHFFPPFSAVASACERPGIEFKLHLRPRPQLQYQWILNPLVQSGDQNRCLHSDQLNGRCPHLAAINSFPNVFLICERSTHLRKVFYQAILKDLKLSELSDSRKSLKGQILLGTTELLSL